MLSGVEEADSVYSHRIEPRLLRALVRYPARPSLENAESHRQDPIIRAEYVILDANKVSSVARHERQLRRPLGRNIVRLRG